MTDQQLEQRLRSWYRAEVGEAERAPAALRASVAAIPRPSSTFDWRMSRRFPTLNLQLRFAVAAAIGVLAVGGALYLLRPSQPSIGTPSQSPGLSSNPTSVPSPTAVPIPTARAVALIAFMRELDNPPAGMPPGPNRLWVVGADGSDPRDLFPNDLSNDKVDPVWSPDGSRLLFSNLGMDKLYLTDASGSDPVLLDTGCPECTDSDASYSSDGSRIVFVRTRPGPWQGGQPEGWHTILATMDLGTGRVFELGSTIEAGDGGPRWSPDGTQIVFSRSWLAMPEKFLKAAVFVVDADGQHLRQLTPATLQARAPDWSPDGSRIVFESLDMRTVGGTVRTSDDIYSIHPDGTGLQRLTTDGLSNGATWMPDGRLLFTRVLGGSSGRAAGGFWVMDADGGNVAELVPAALIASDNYDESGGGRDATWQPMP